MAQEEQSFDSIAVVRLATMADAERDMLPFGVVGLDGETVVRTYNATEARMSGLDPATVVGVPFFDAVAQCMNNFLVAQRFEDEAELDETIPYVLTLRMRPTKVRLRLLKTPATDLSYILIER